VSATWYRTIWLSDVHLGTRGSKALALLELLTHLPAGHRAAAEAVLA
jgi:hypothetical protein